MSKTIQIKPSLYVLRESDTVYKVVMTGRRKILTFDTNQLVRDVIENLSERKGLDSFYREMCSRGYDTNELNQCITAMEHNGIIRVNEDCFKDEKYRKQIEFIDEFTRNYSETLDIHNRLRNSSIALFGAGGIGSWMVNGLSQIGIGNLRICDPDKIELSNLNRQLFFQEKDIGKYKVEVLKERIDGPNIKTYKLFISENSDLEEIVSGTNFIVNSADSPSVHYTSNIIDKYARKHQIPYMVSGGYNLHLGMVGPIIVPNKTKSFEDFLEYQKSKDPLRNLNVVKDIESTGSIGPIAGAIANIQVMEIFKHITGLGETNLNKFVEIDFMNLNTKWNLFG